MLKVKSNDRIELVKKFKTTATFKGKPINIEMRAGRSIDNHEGAKVVLVEKTAEEVVSSVTGKSLGRKEKVIGQGTFEDGRVSIACRDGEHISIPIETVSVPVSTLGTKGYRMRTRTVDRRHGIIKKQLYVPVKIETGIQGEQKDASGKIVLRIME